MFCLATLREEFQLSNFGFGHFDPDLFVNSQWKWGRWWYVASTVFWFLWHLGWLIASGVVTGDGRWFIYSSNLTYILMTLTTLLNMVIVCYIHVARGGTFHLKVSTPWYIKLLWLMYSVINATSIVVTIVFFAWRFEDQPDFTLFGVNVYNTVYVLENLFYTAMPVRLLHFVYPMIWFTLYFLFQVAYYVQGGLDIDDGHEIYSGVKWGEAEPTVYIIIFVFGLGVPLAHFIMFAIYNLRMFVYRKVYEKE